MYTLIYYGNFKFKKKCRRNQGVTTLKGFRNSAVNNKKVELPSCNMISNNDFKLLPRRSFLTAPLCQLNFKADPSTPIASGSFKEIRYTFLGNGDLLRTS